MMTEHKTKSSIATVGCMSASPSKDGAVMQWRKLMLKKPDGQGI